MAFINGTQFNDNGTVNGGAFRPILNGTNFADNIFGLAGNDILLGRNGQDNLFGGSGNDRLVGGNGEDDLSGQAGNDTLLGGSGEDDLNGGSGNDVLIGGAGEDDYEFSTALGANNVDQIFGFSAASDDIELLDSIFANLPGDVLPQNFRANATGTAVDANDFLVYNTTTGALSYDSNGNGAGGSVQFAVLIGAPAISAANFDVADNL